MFNSFNKPQFVNEPNPIVEYICLTFLKGSEKELGNKLAWTSLYFIDFSDSSNVQRRGSNGDNSYNHVLICWKYTVVLYRVCMHMYKEKKHLCNSLGYKQSLLEIKASEIIS